MTSGFWKALADIAGDSKATTECGMSESDSLIDIRLLLLTVLVFLLFFLVFLFLSLNCGSHTLKDSALHHVTRYMALRGNAAVTTVFLVFCQPAKKKLIHFGLSKVP